MEGTVYNDRRFSLWLPAIWAACSFFQYFFSGDEYMLYALGSLPGIWLYYLALLPQINTIFFPLCISLAGCIPLFGVGCLMQRFRLRPTVFLASWFAMLVFVGANIVLTYDSYASAIAKNGSIMAYILFAVNVGLILAIPVSCILTIGLAIIRKYFSKHFSKVDSCGLHK